MKNALTTILSCTALLTSMTAVAGDFPMSGQDVTYHSAGASLTLSRSNNDLSLEDGKAYRLRFSNASSSFHIMPGDGTDNEFKVSGGFPGGNLQNFSNLDGAKFGNPGVFMSASTSDQVLSVGPIVQRDYSCSYVCGTQTVCRDVPDQVCHTTDNQTCRDVPEQVCRTQNGQQVCQTVTRRECSNDPVTTCDTVYRRVCSDENTYCSGTEVWEVRDTTSGHVYKVSFTDSASNAIGGFESTTNVNTSVDKVNLISTTCR